MAGMRRLAKNILVLYLEEVRSWEWVLNEQFEINERGICITIISCDAVVVWLYHYYKLVAM